MSKEETSHSSQLLVQKHLFVTILIKYAPRQGFPARCLLGSFHFNHVFLFFHLLFNPIVFSRPLTCSFIFGQHTRVFFWFIVTLSKIDLGFIKSRKGLKRILIIIFQFLEVELLVFIQSRFNRFLRQARRRPSNKESFRLFTRRAYVCEMKLLCKQFLLH